MVVIFFEEIHKGLQSSDPSTCSTHSSQEGGETGIRAHQFGNVAEQKDNCLILIGLELKGDNLLIRWIWSSKN